MNKKSLFLIGGLSTMAVIAPIVVATSCSTAVTPEVTQFINVTVKPTVTDKITNKDVAANPITQATLAKIFTGVDATTFAQFTSSWNATTNKVTLTPKTGYKFGTADKPEDKLESIALTITTILEITAIPNLTNAGITATEIAATSLTLETLQKAFTGITTANMANFTAAITEIPNNTPALYFITLTAKDGFGFDNRLGNQLTSSTFNAK
ncbi:MAG: hypothetical protein ACRDAW_02415 [Metamycoplasmataceae bacterium]